MCLHNVNDISDFKRWDEIDAYLCFNVYDRAAENLEEEYREYESYVGNYFHNDNISDNSIINVFKD